MLLFPHCPLYCEKFTKIFPMRESKWGRSKIEELKHNGGFPSKVLYVSNAWLQNSEQIGNLSEDSTSHSTITRSDISENESSCITYTKSRQLHVCLFHANWNVKPRSFPCCHIHTSNLRTSMVDETKVVCSRPSTWLNVVT